MTGPDEDPRALRLTRDLLRQAKAGDPAALDVLMARYLPRLQRWASGRLPLHARSLLETTDLVHDTLLKAIATLETIDVRSPGGFQAYVRQAIMNAVCDQVRWANRRLPAGVAPESLHDHTPSPLENAIGSELLERYEQARDQLSEDERVLVHLKVELDLGYDEIAAMTGRASRDAARMALQRAVRKLGELMGRPEQGR